MCTLSFIPTGDGFLVGMNRDELRSRGAAAPPSLHEIRGLKAVFPLDIQGGTWIAAAESRNCFALLNRNGGTRSQKRRSRGEVVTQVLGCHRFPEVESTLNQLDLREYLPFRLVGIFSSAMQVFEWIWDGRRLATIAHGWQPRHWFSSGISDAEATSARGRIFDVAWSEAEAGNSEWLRQVHRSHGNSPGAFSVCVHRDDAASLSYTEVSVNQSQVSMSYHPGSPCQNGPISQIVIPRLQTDSSL